MVIQDVVLVTTVPGLESGLVYTVLEEDVGLLENKLRHKTEQDEEETGQTLAL